MKFRQYSTNEATINEWSRQLSIVNGGVYNKYPTVASTLNHWKDTLNQKVGDNTFDIYGNDEKTIQIWKDKLNNIYMEGDAE